MNSVDFGLELSDYNDALCARQERGEDLPFLSASNMLSTAFLEDPSPRWIKNIDGRMLAANPAFQRVYGVPIEDCISGDEYKFWDTDTLSQFTESDEIVKSTKKVYRVVEKVNKDSVLVTKYPIFNSDGDVVAVAGITFNHWGQEFNGRTN